MSTREEVITAIAGELGKSRLLRPVAGHLRQIAAVAYETAAPLIRAEQREQDARLAADHKATYGTFCADSRCQRQHGTAATGRASFADLLRAQP